jgi:hypothetical protein
LAVDYSAPTFLWTFCWFRGVKVHLIDKNKARIKKYKENIKFPVLAQNKA